MGARIAQPDSPDLKESTGSLFTASGTAHAGFQPDRFHRRQRRPFLNQRRYGDSRLRFQPVRELAPPGFRCHTFTVSKAFSSRVLRKFLGPFLDAPPQVLQPSPDHARRNLSRSQRQFDGTLEHRYTPLPLCNFRRRCRPKCLPRRAIFSPHHRLGRRFRGSNRPSLFRPQVFFAVFQNLLQKISRTCQPMPYMRGRAGIMFLFSVEISFQGIRRTAGRLVLEALHSLGCGLPTPSDQCRLASPLAADADQIATSPDDHKQDAIH